MLNHHKKYIKETLEKTETSKDPDHIVCTIMQKFKDENVITLTEDHINYVAPYLHYSKAKDAFSFNTKRKSPTLYSQYFEKYLEKLTSMISNVFSAKVEEDVSSEIYSDEPQEPYVYPEEKVPTLTKFTDDRHGPYGTQWVHDEQVDDEENTINLEKFNELRKIILPEQKSEAWFAMRNDKITASDGGTVIDLNKHEQQYTFIIKKTRGSEFLSNKFCYHGTKFESIATSIYEYRMNCKVDEFGLLGHPKYSFLGASPDGICSGYKLDGIHKSKLVGRMLEIKCPLVRKIIKKGPLIDNICPVYYWVQVQLQLECCDLDECDFWQCNISEYKDRQEFLDDTDIKEPFRSKIYGYEKGCLIQLLPIDKMADISYKYFDTVYNNAKIIYPPKVNMSPYDCDIWIANTLSSLKEEYPKFTLDRIIYWKLEDSHNVTINRDKNWFASKLPEFEKMWNYVLFFRKNEDKLQILEKVINLYHNKKGKNAKIMNVVDLLFNGKDKEVNKILSTIPVTAAVIQTDDCLFSDEQQPLPKKKESIFMPYTPKNTNDCLFSD